MIRDVDLVRLILLEIEKKPYTGNWLSLNIENYSSDEISHHLVLLSEAGLIEAVNAATLGGEDWRAKRLTWQGYEFLEAARDEARWNKTKEAMKTTGGFMFEVAKLLLTDYLKQELKLTPR